MVATLTFPIDPAAWRRVPLALLAGFLLLAWAPALLYLDHWPAPALLIPAAAEVTPHAHPHDDSGSDTATHLAHGHGVGGGMHGVAALMALFMGRKRKEGV